MNKNNNEQTRAHTGDRDIRLLLAGAAAGLAIAAYGILERDDTVLPADAVASINEVIITRAQVDRALTRGTTYSASQPAADEFTRLVDQLIDEELMLQRGVELGMMRSDVTVRAAIINSLIASVTAEADAANPEDADLAAHLADNGERFSTVSGIELDAWQGEEESVAQAFATALRNGEDPMALEKRRDIPQQLVPLEEIRDLLGPGIAASAAGMPPGSIAVFARRGYWVVVRVNNVMITALTELAPIRNRVLLDYRRELADRQLRDYLASLRERAEIRVRLP